MEELCLEEQARKGYDYLCFRVGQGLSAQEKESFWAIANNAALIFFLERSELKFCSVEEVLEKYSLEEIAERLKRTGKFFRIVRFSPTQEKVFPGK